MLIVSAQCSAVNPLMLMGSKFPSYDLSVGSGSAAPTVNRHLQRSRNTNTRSAHVALHITPHHTTPHHTTCYNTHSWPADVALHGPVRSPISPLPASRRRLSSSSSPTTHAPACSLSSRPWLRARMSVWICCLAGRLCAATPLWAGPWGSSGY